MHHACDRLEPAGRQPCRLHAIGKLRCKLCVSVINQHSARLAFKLAEPYAGGVGIAAVVVGGGVAGGGGVVAWCVVATVGGISCGRC